MTENKIYNPAAQPKEWLIENFVVRTNVFEKIFKDINKGEMKYPEQHYIIQGQRGMGKTTLLLRLKYEIENTPKLNTWLLPVFFTEEMYDLTTLSNLWEKLLIYLDNQFGSALYKETDKYIGTNDYEKRCFELLISALKSNKKKLILFFDNFGELFLDNLNDKDQHRLREVLMNCAEIRIIGASAIVLTDLYNYSKPFYEFFKIINLEGLNKDETFQLIKKLEEKSEHPINLEKSKAKIETLAILTGGVIRTVMLIYEAILADQDGSALKDLETILDKITPLYKHRMEVFPPAQRKIIDVIAKKWDAISTKEISESIRENGQLVPSKNISAQLQQLEKNNIIEKKQTNTKNNLYQLKERFFNIWYLMRHGDRYDQCRVKWLTKFLELWYEDEKGFKGFLNEHFLHLQSGNYHANSALMISEALVNSDKLNILSLDLLIKKTGEILNKEQKKLLPDISEKTKKELLKCYKENDWETVIELLKDKELKSELEKVILSIAYLNTQQQDASFKLINTFEVSDNQFQFPLGLFYFKVQQYEKCINVLENYSGEEEALIFELLGNSYFFLNNNIKAIEYLTKALNKKNYDAYLLLVKIHIENKDLILAEKYCIEGIENEYAKSKKELIYLYCINQFALRKSKVKVVIENSINLNSEDPDNNFLMGLFYYLSSEPLKSIKYYLSAFALYKKNNKLTPYCYANTVGLFDLIINHTRDKITAINLIKDLKWMLAQINPKLSQIIGGIASFIAIWDNKYKEGINLILKWYSTFESIEVEYFLNDIEKSLLLLLSKKQYHSVLRIFDNEELNYKEKFKPIYYALMHYLKDEYPNEYLKMGDELKQPVADVMKRVEEMKVLYK